MQPITPDILLACAQRDPRAISRLYKQLYSLMMGIAIRYEKNKEEASDCVNQSFLKVLEKIEEVKNVNHFELWVKRITVHTAIDQYRKRKKEKEYCINMEAEMMENYTLASSEMDLFTAEMLEDMLKELPELPAQVFNLYAIDGYSHKEIAEMLGIGESTSRWALSNARKKLKALLTQYLEENKITTNRL